MSRVALATAGVGLLAAGAAGQDRIGAVRGPGDPGIVTTGPVSGIAPRGAEVCNGTPVTFTGTVLRSELVGIPDVRTALIRAENFTTDAAGDLGLTTVTWWGTYSNNIPSAEEDFRIRILGDNGAGSPDATNVLAFETAFTGSNLTRTDTGILVGTANLYRYDYTLSSPVTLEASTCYWAEIAQEDVNDANAWNWATDNDDSRYHRTDIDGQYGPYSQFLSAGFDPAVCLDVALGVDACPIAVSDDPCVQDITLPDTTCQGPINGSGINFSGADDFQLADDFTVGGTGSFTLSEICWRGAYVVPGSPFINFAPAPFDNFSIAIYENDNGAPGTIVATLLQGTDFTLARGYDLIEGAHEFAATISTPVMVTGGQCYWISIINDVGDIRWGWYPSLLGNLASHRSDPASAAGWPDVFDLTTRFDDDTDFNFCMSVEIAPGGCAPPVCNAPANDECFNAIALTVGGAPVIGTNVCATRDPFVAEPCGFMNMGFGDVYYSVTNTSGSDMDLTASTNFASTVIDSRIGVYCTGGGTPCTDPLNCVVSDDDGGGANFTSVATWTAVAGETYYIRVDGYDLGEFGIQVTAAAASGAAAPCQDCELEDVTDPPPAGTVVEAEPCGTNTNDGVGTAEAGPSADGGIWRGTAYADNNDRDFDYFSFTLDQDSDLQFTWRSEFPLLYNLLDANGTFIDGFFIAADCGDGVVTTSIVQPAGTYFIIYLHASGGVSTPNNFYGAPCGTHDEMAVTIQALAGACCVGDGTCVQAMSEEDCTLTFSGTFQGVGTECGTVECSGGPTCACETDGDANQVNVFDLLAYLDNWFPSNPAADIDGVAGVDVFDLLFFLDCWFPASAGNPCP